MGRVIAVTNLKGGIGKTTTVVNVSAGMALKGARVLLIDVDAQGNLAMAFGLRPKHTLYEALVDGTAIERCITPVRPGLDLIAADESLLTAQPVIATRSDWSRVLEQAIRPIRNQYDFLFIDCGGSLTVLNTNALVAASDLLVPTTVEPFSIRGIELLLKQVHQVKRQLAATSVIVPTMYDARRSQSTDLLNELQTRYGGLVAAPIRVNVRLSEASAEGKTIYEYDRRSRGALDYAILVEHLATRWGYQSTAAPKADPLVAAAEPPRPMQAPPSAPPAAGADPVVTGAGQLLGEQCPNCGHPLRRATVAGYRVAYCEHCRYRRQDLARGGRR